MAGLDSCQGLYFLGLKLLNGLVAEFNRPIAGRTLSQHRKYAVHFRDNHLVGLVEIALTALQQLKGGSEDLQKQVSQINLLFTQTTQERT